MLLLSFAHYTLNRFTDGGTHFLAQVLLELKAKYDKMLEKSFKSDPAFRKSMNQVCMASNRGHYSFLSSACLCTSNIRIAFAYSFRTTQFRTTQRVLGLNPRGFMRPLCRRFTISSTCTRRLQRTLRSM